MPEALAPDVPLPPLPAKHQEALDKILIHLCVKPAPARDGPPPRKRAKVLEARSPPERLRNAARFFVRGVHLDQNLSCVLDDGAEARWKGTDISDLTPEQAATVAAHTKSFDALICHVPDLEPVLQYIYAHHSNAWELLVKELHKVARQTRCNDSNEFKHETHYFVPNPGLDVLDPPLGTGESKEDRGFKHGFLRLLCMPWRDRITQPPWSFKSIAAVPDTRSDEQKARGDRIMRRIDAKVYKPNPKLFPSFLYEDGSYDKENPLNGLFRGYLVIRNIRHTWTTPTTATIGLGHNGLPRRCHARTHRSYRVTPPKVGYAVSHAYVMLMPYDWDNCPGLSALYDSVLKVFLGEHVDDEWAEETLAYLQSQVYGQTATQEPAHDPSLDSDEDEDECDHMEKIQMLAMARRSEREAAATAGDSDS